MLQSKGLTAQAGANVVTIYELSLLFFCSFTASAVGALLISLTLSLTDSFSIFLYFVTGAVSVSAMLFMLMPKARDFVKIGEETTLLKAAE